MFFRGELGTGGAVIIFSGLIYHYFIVFLVALYLSMLDFSMVILNSILEMLLSMSRGTTRYLFLFIVREWTLV